MFTLYIRSEKQKQTTRVNAAPASFHSEGKYLSYREAVINGQRLGGYGNFYVNAPFVPSREEQLLIEPKKSQRRSSAAREAALLED